MFCDLCILALWTDIPEVMQPSFVLFNTDLRIRGKKYSAVQRSADKVSAAAGQAVRQRRAIFVASARGELQSAGWVLQWPWPLELV